MDSVRKETAAGKSRSSVCLAGADVSMAMRPVFIGLKAGCAVGSGSSSSSVKTLRTMFCNPLTGVFGLLTLLPSLLQYAIAISMSRLWSTFESGSARLAHLWKKNPQSRCGMVASFHCCSHSVARSSPSLDRTKR